MKPLSVGPVAVLAALVLLAGAPSGGAAPAAKEARITIFVRVTGERAVASGVVRPFRVGSRILLVVQQRRGATYRTLRTVPTRVLRGGRYRARLVLPSGGDCRVHARRSPDLSVQVDFGC